MKEDRHQESALKTAARGTNLVLLIASAVVVIGAVLYFGLGA